MKFLFKILKIRWIIKERLKNCIVSEAFDTKNVKKRFCIINCIGTYEKTSSSYTYLGVIKDVTKRRQLNRQLVRAEKLTMTGKIARTIAHEVRNPLTNLSLALDQLKDEIEGKVEDADLYVSIIERNSNRIGDLINDLLDSSRPREVKLSKQSLKQVIESSVSIIEDRLKLKNMKLDMDLSAEIPELMIDRSQIEIALSNLFINAIEAMKEDMGVLGISVSEKDDNVMLKISDNGSGIPEEDLDGLFEPYFTSKKQGTGLGLTTVQNILNAHQASISVESELGVGTNFNIFFPTEI
jgi:signal transduction histidine kinase